MVLTIVTVIAILAFLLYTGLWIVVTLSKPQTEIKAWFPVVPAGYGTLVIYCILVIYRSNQGFILVPYDDQRRILCQFEHLHIRQGYNQSKKLVGHSGSHHYCDCDRTHNIYKPFH